MKCGFRSQYNIIILLLKIIFSELINAGSYTGGSCRGEWVKNHINTK